MASAQIGLEFKIPVVTSEDLRKFQEIHFGPKDSSTEAGPRVNTDHVAKGAAIAEEDDLGYYADGVKRTLTDEQIAMFRHSEIYALQRKRQLRKENQEVDDTFSDTLTNLETQDTQPGVDGEATFVSPEQSIDNFMKHYGPGGKNRCDFHTVEESLTDMTEPAPSAQMNKGSITGTSKRRKADNNQGRNKNNSTTSRRQARELDDAVADTGILDYGEESSVLPSIEPKTERVKVEYADQDDMSDFPIKQESVPPREGRKIWWPNIG